jgi:ADP-L-glycero-D-manno-heptose 6-epimerase
MSIAEDYIIVTGAAGFIGSCMVGYLNRQGVENIIIVDEFAREDKFPNLEGKKYSFKIERDNLFDWLQETNMKISFIYHLGARTDTTEFDYSIHQRLNVDYSMQVWQYCITRNVPLVYASSAATYGSGELGYDDNHSLPEKLKPLNPYGVSKNVFDIWALQQERQPPHWYGLKFFNVYGPNEYHKARMASVIFHSFNQIRDNGFVKLFRSHRPDFKDGQQLRDFIYVKDVIKVCYWLQRHLPASGIYNLGTGIARSFQDLVTSTFAGIGRQPDIRFIDMPEDIRDKYQYFTEAKMTKLEKAGYVHPFYTLEEGVTDYVSKYLVNKSYY